MSTTVQDQGEKEAGQQEVATQEDELVEEEEDDEGTVREQHDLDCPLCRALLYEPLTTACGHNFCRSCLVRALDYSNRCPVCRSIVFLAPNHAVNSVLKNLAASTFPKEYRRRAEQNRSEIRDLHQHLPLFVMFPGMSLDLHVFEPRYRNLVAHSLTSSRCFGIINGSASVGCVVEINSYLRIPDGRSLLVVKGTSRFNVLKRWESAEYGYEVAEVDVLEDETEDVHQTATDGDVQSLQSLASELRVLVQQKIPSSAMQTAQQQLGPLPTNPQALSFWLGAYLSVGLDVPSVAPQLCDVMEAHQIALNQEKQGLLELTSVRERLAREKQLLLDAPDRTIRRPSVPVVARTPFIDSRRGLLINSLVIALLVLVIIWYFLTSFAANGLDQ